MLHTKRTFPAQQFELGVQQAQQILDRRAGRTPATSHDVVDFLLDREFWRIETEFDKWPPPTLAPRDALSLDVRAAMAWLRVGARAPQYMADSYGEVSAKMKCSVLQYGPSFGWTVF